jgi:hypothetical protein
MEIESDRSASIDGRNRKTTSSKIAAETVVTSRTTAIAPASIVAAVVAVVLLLLGGITLARAGLDGSLDVPIVSVAGFTATAILGLIEIGFGLILLLAALAQERNAIMFVAIIGGVSALVVVFQPTLGEVSLGIERGFAVLAAIVMAAIVVSALLPSFTRRSVVQRVSDQDRT